MKKNVIIVNIGFDPRYIPSVAKVGKKNKIHAWDDKNYFDIVIVEKKKKNHKHKKH